MRHSLQERKPNIFARWQLFALFGWQPSVSLWLSKEWDIHFTIRDKKRYCEVRFKANSRLALSPSGSLLIAVDIDGMAILINYTKRVLLHHFNFKAKVCDLKFSPDSKLLVVSHGKLVQIWHAPGYTREFAPFVLFKEYPGNYDSVLSITWSKDSKYFLTTGKDLTCRLYAVDSQSFTGACLTGHNDVVIGAWFSHNEKKIYTVC